MSVAEMDFIALQGCENCVKAENASQPLRQWTPQQPCRLHDWCALQLLASRCTQVLGSACWKGGAARVPTGTQCTGGKWEAWWGFGKDQWLHCIRSVLSSPYITLFLCTGNNLWVFHLQILLAHNLAACCLPKERRQLLAVSWHVSLPAEVQGQLFLHAA